MSALAIRLEAIMKAGYARRGVMPQCPRDPEALANESDFILDAEEPDPESDELEARELVWNALGHPAEHD